ncbi:MAG: 3-dehydroquinate synthase [Anaerostipes sp.]|nr:3-dehydroquinate synthase [Anaerostipes sp.]
MKNIIPVSEDGKKIYEIHLETSFDQLLDSMKTMDLEHRKICIVTEGNVAPLYLGEVYKIFKSVAKEVVTFSFAAGEAHKQLKTVEQLYGHLIEHQFDRKDMLIALGGGVVGDLTGFTAATYLRGIDFVQVPTTLLSQVDSSIGGKTGVDMLQYKNMVGAFHQPKLVYINVNTLISLPERVYNSGMGEIIKHGLIQDAVYYQWMQRNLKSIKQRNLQVLIKMIEGSCQIKRKVVEEDPKELGTRALLNFGHTLGHAVEKLMDFSLLHGECVAIGCQMAMELSFEKGNISKEDVEKSKELFEAFDLFKDIHRLSGEDVVQATKSDKKMEGNIIKFILLHQVGDAYIDRTVTDDEMMMVLKDWVL